MLSLVMLNPSSRVFISSVFRTYRSSRAAMVSSIASKYSFFSSIFFIKVSKYCLAISYCFLISSNDPASISILNSGTFSAISPMLSSEVLNFLSIMSRKSFAFSKNLVSTLSISLSNSCSSCSSYTF